LQPIYKKKFWCHTLPNPSMKSQIRKRGCHESPGFYFSRNMSVQMQTCLSGMGLSWRHHMTFSGLKPDHRF
jgi:hypothetical protein